MSEVAELELAYIGGLLKLDLRYDEEARSRAFGEIAGKRRASPERKG